MRVKTTYAGFTVFSFSAWVRASCNNRHLRNPDVLLQVSGRVTVLSYFFLLLKSSYGSQAAYWLRTKFWISLFWTVADTDYSLNVLVADVKFIQSRGLTEVLDPGKTDKTDPQVLNKIYDVYINIYTCGFIKRCLVRLPLTNRFHSFNPGV